MARIVEIGKTERALSRKGEPYIRTYALVESRRFGFVNVYGYGSDFAVGDNVMVFFHDKYNVGKMIPIKS